MSPKPTKTSTCEADSITENIQQLTLETQPEDLYKLLHGAPDNYFPQQSNNPETDLKSEIQHTTKHHVTIKTTCNNEKQPLLNEDLTEHIQFDKERNLSYLPISTSLTLKRKRHMYYIPMDFEKLTLDGSLILELSQVQSQNKTSTKSSCSPMRQKKKPVPHRTSKLWWQMDN